MDDRKGRKGKQGKEKENNGDEMERLIEGW